jgi:hypothetical protein
MIISASYKTDIPTFYGEWFLNRLRAGYCRAVNPHSGRPFRVSLRRDSVDGFVFWTKNAAPFLGALREVKERGYPFVVQYTINSYPRELESRVVDAVKSVECVRRIGDTYGSRVPVWRYDTIVLTTLTDYAFHRRNFEQIATALEGSVDEVVVSVMYPYKKTLRNLRGAALARGFDMLPENKEQQRALIVNLAEIASSRGMQLTVCSQPEQVVGVAGVARCVDAARMSDVAGSALNAKLKGNREACGCFESRDIGSYDSCPHGCVYCYAVTDDVRARARYHSHDPQSDSLFPPSRLEGAESSGRVSGAQLPLLGLDGDQ